MMNKIYFKLILLPIVYLVLFSCTDDLDRYPTNGINSEIQFNSLEGYEQGLNTLYGVLNNNGPSWNGGLIRKYFELQEAPTDEAILYWSPFNTFDWSVDNNIISYHYATLIRNISYANNFLIESEPETVSKRGFSGEEAETIDIYRAEARFLRALHYWMLMDLFGNPPFATEETLKKSAIPEQINRVELFAYIESELLDIEDNMIEPRQNEYGRADKAAAWALLSRLYLNGEVYTGNKFYSQAITYSKKVIDAGYSLETNYEWLFLADNHLNTNEFIFSIPFDNNKIITWEGTNFLALGQAGIPESMNGMSGSWNLFAFTPELVDLFPTEDTSMDKRAMIWTENRIKEFESLSNNAQGYSAYKFRNIDRNGIAPVQNNANNNISDIDFPIFRLAESYFIYAEAVLRGGSGGNISEALGYINKLRERAYGNSSGNITDTELNLDFILDERARELYWECHRRTDLIRFEKFTSANYLWAWKGGIKEGKGVSEKFRIYPLPNADVLSNPNLTQNPNY
ncbi:MAG: RagB/SusD family nutrient uptake outer membrane protein [Bacteroidales bacterium]|nr:RagB/SusD family nutrient uptake outer membrane protein [Bacteroidales bacterium]